MKYALITILSFCFLHINAQERSWQEKMGDPNVSFFEIQRDFYESWGQEEIPRGSGYKPFKRWEYFMETRVDENGFFNPQKSLKEYSKYKSSLPPYKSNNPWTILGPSNQPTGNNGIGRINVINVHPNDPNKIYIGTPAGGMWTSDNGGSSWTTVTDTLESLGVSNILFDPVDPNIMYISTGDRDHNDTPTSGLLKSIDGGTTWNHTNFQPGLNGLPNFFRIHRVIIDPSNGDNIIASTTSGVFRSSDGATTWSQTLSGNCLRHMELHPTNSNIIYGTTSTSFCGGLNNTAIFYKSTDNGVTWTTTSIPTSNGLNRIGIGISISNPNAVFLFASNSSTNNFEGVYKSTNSGVSFVKVNTTSSPNLGGQSWYDWSFTVDPSNENIMYGGGVNIARSTNGGVTWNIVTNNGPNNVHVDHHYAKHFGSYLYVGSDGGIWRTNNNASSWEVLNDGLAITQYYRISNAETDQNIVMAGAQDNGTHQLKNGNWIFEFGGDGMDNAIDPNDKNNLFLSWQNGNFYRSTNGGSNFSLMINSNTTGTSGAWVSPIKIDETNTSIIYVGYDRIWKSTNDGISWSDPLGQSLTGGNKLRYIDVAPSNGNYIYTTDYNRIWKSTNGGTSWTTTNDPGNSIRWIEIDPSDPNHLWVTSSQSIFESTNGGASWNNITGTLPNIDMNTIVYDANSNDGLYVGTDYGVFYKNNSTSGWQPFGTDLPNVVVLELDILESGDKIRAATYGRGVWEASLETNICSISNVIDLGIESCDPPNNMYNRLIEVTYSSPPGSGTLDVMSQSFNITTSPQTVSIELPSDGSNSNNVTAEFSADSNCTLTVNGLFDNPVVSSYFTDNDNDGFGNNLRSFEYCFQLPGYASNSLDCNDDNETIYPNAPEICDGLINDCNSTNLPNIEIDNDGDGYVECAFDIAGWDGDPAVIGGDDCDDNEILSFPGNPEICDNIDNNCDGNVDEIGGTLLYADADGDGFGDPNTSSTNCNPPAGYIADSSDCDDTNNKVYPGAPEICDGVINDCNGSTLPLIEIDNDGDGYVECTIDATGWNGDPLVVGGDDCDDNQALNYPGNTEVCDGIDNNCDSNIDEGLLSTYYIDSDNDGFGDINISIQDCSVPSGYVINSLDCNDNNNTIYPGATELCDGIINDCNTSTLTLNEQDNDGDGYVECTIDAGGWQGNNSVVGGDDCDDAQILSFPGNTEICDGIDNNCDTNIDENGNIIFFADTDNDGFGDPNNTIMACSPQTGYITDNTDCDDTNAKVYPGAPELCDGIINNCNSSTLPLSEVDNDGDKYVECSIDVNGWQGNSMIIGGNDCDDAQILNYPGNIEVCDGIDNNCDNVIDEGCGPPPDCDDTYLVINTITQNSYHAEINITSDALINNGQSILYTAGQTIDLDPPFEVVQGTTFEAKITPCITSSANLILGDDTIDNRNLKELYNNIITHKGSSHIISIILTDLKGEENSIIENYDTYEAFVESIILENRKGIYIIKIDNGTDSITQKVLFVE